MKSAIYRLTNYERLRNLSLYSIVSAKNKCDYTSSTINNDNNHKNYNFLNCDWFKKLLFPTNSLAQLLSDSLLSDSSTNQSNSKL